jgi:hypothetical protein
MAVVVPFASQRRLARSSLVLRLLRAVSVGSIASLFVVTCGAAVAAAQSVSEPAATAAFLLNFARFTQWTADARPETAPLTICATDRDVAEALAATVKGRAAGNRPVVARRLEVSEAPGDCEVLYVTGIDRRRAGPLLQSVSGASVLTVSDESGFAAWGGCIELFIEDGRMGFMINRAAAERAGLRFSSRLLALARLLKD